MARRLNLKNAAQGLAGSFASRNNDFDGYWELAKLYDYAIEKEVSEVVIDIVTPSISPQGKDLNYLINMWRDKFNQMLVQMSLSKSWIHSSEITVMFNQPYNRKLHQFGEHGEPCTIVCTIKSDLGRKFSAKTGTKCMPFSKASFSRSTRRKTFNKAKQA